MIAAFVATLWLLGLHRRRTWIAVGILAAHIAWTLTVGQAQSLVTLLLILGNPAAVALAGQFENPARPGCALLAWPKGLAPARSIRRLVAPPDRRAVDRGACPLDRLSEEHKLGAGRPGQQPVAIRDFTGPVARPRGRRPAHHTQAHTDPSWLGDCSQLLRPRFAAPSWIRPNVPAGRGSGPQQSLRCLAMAHRRPTLLGPAPPGAGRNAQRARRESSR
jgi:hypothetical protein